MRHDENRWIPTTSISLAIVLVIMVLSVVPDVLAQNQRVTSGNNKMIIMTGRIDRIGKNDITINDTWYKFSDNISIAGYKVGDRISYISTDEYEIIKIGRTDKRRQPKE